MLCAKTPEFCVVEWGMTNEELTIITAIWDDVTLRIKLEINPYGLTQDELRSLQANDFLNDLLLSGLGADAGELPVL